MALDFFTEANPCLICEGWGHPRRSDKQCSGGVLMEDRSVVYCSVLSEVNGIKGELSSSGKSWRYDLDAPYIFKPEQQKRSRGKRHVRYGEPPERPPGVPADWVRAAVYEYAHEDGWILFFIERWVSPDGKEKSFWPILNGAANYLLPDWARRPYRLPELLEAIKRGLPIFIVEGEKDVDSGYAHADEAAFTCNPSGARAWLPKYSFARWFEDAEQIIIVADRDDSGRRWAQDVQEDLASKATQIVQARVGKDLTDHLAGGFALAELEPV